MVDADGDEVTRNNTVDGPVQANRRMVTNEDVATYQNFVGRNGSRVRFGNILILPVENSLVYLRPIYAAEEGSSRFTLQRVVVASGEDVGFGRTVGEAVDDLLGVEDGVEGEAPDDVPTGGDGGPDEPSEPAPPTSGPSSGESPEELLAEADRLFTEADARLSEGDLAGYDQLITQAVELVRRASRVLGADTAPSDTAAAN